MDYLVDKYLKKPDYVKELFNKPVTVSLKIDGSAFQIFYNKEEDKIEYHKRGGSSSKLGPIIDEYTQLFTKHLNDAIDFFDDKKDILKLNKFYAIEIFNDMYVLLTVIDNNDNIITDVSNIAKKLNIESLPILFNGKLKLNDDIISLFTLDEKTSNNDFISALKSIFGGGDYEKFLKGDEIEGIVLTWVIDDKPLQYKIINPAFKTRHEKEQNDKLKEAERDTEQLNKLIKLLYDRLSDVAKHRDDNWIKNLDLNFFEMCSDPNWLQDAKNIAKEITPNNNKWFMLQTNKVSSIIKDLLSHNGNEMKTIYEKYLMTFNKPKKRAFIISKEFQNNINNIIEKLQSVKESLKIYTKINMKSLNEYINEEKKTTGAGCVEMVKMILDQLKNEYSDCSYNKEKQAWTGKDADLWKGAGQFLFDYMHDLNQSDFKKIVDAMGWKKWIPDVNDIHPAEISMCMSLELNK